MDGARMRVSSVGCGVECTPGAWRFHAGGRGLVRTAKHLIFLEWMKYADGQEVRLGDRVKLGQDDGGAVVASIDTGEYSAEHPESQWSYLKRGVMIQFPTYGKPAFRFVIISTASRSGT
jgi:hypothetical protein